MWHFADLRFANSIFFIICGLTSASPQIHIFSPTNIEKNSLIKFVQYKKSFKKLTFTTVMRQSCALYCGNLRICDLQINHENLRTCDLRTSTQKIFAYLRKQIEPKNLRFADFKKLSLLTHLCSIITRGGRKVRLIDFLIPIRSSDCIGRYSRLMPSSDFCIGRW